MWPAVRRVLLLLPCAAAGQGLWAQVVNIEGRRFLNDTLPWQGYVNFRFNVAENGQRAMNLGLNGAVQYIDGRDRSPSGDEAASSCAASVIHARRLRAAG